MNTFEIIYTAIMISVFISICVTALGCHVRDKKISELKDENIKLKSRVDELECFVHDFNDHYRTHLKGHRY